MNSPRPEPSDLSVDDPDIPHDAPHDSAFAFGDSIPIGQTERIARESAVYEAGRRGENLNRGHAVGGTDGSTEGQ